MEKQGKIIWTELLSTDIEKSKSFFAAVAGWTYDSMPMGEEVGPYVLAKVEGEDRPAAGIMTSPTGPDGKQFPEHWVSYIQVDDVDKSVATVKSSGGAVHREPFDIPNIGRIAIIGAPGGSIIGLMKPAEH